MREMITRTPDMIAGEINTIKEQVRSTAVMASVEIGRRLKEAKGLVPEGQWTEWLQGRVSYSLRTAQNLMALASEWDAGHGAALEGMTAAGLLGVFTGFHGNGTPCEVKCEILLHYIYILSKINQIN